MSNTSTNNKRIAKNTLLLYFRMIVLMLVTLYTSRVVLNALGVEDYGVYNVVGGVVAMFGFINSSMSSATQRYITFTLGKGDKANSDIDERITKALKPLGDSIGDIRQQTSDISKSIKDNLLFATPPSDTDGNASTSNVDIRTLPLMFCIVFYICQRCVDTGKPFPFFIWRNVAEKQAYYCLGVINSLSAFRPELMTIVRGAEYTQITITRFDAGALGITSLEELKESLSELLEREKYKNLFKELDMYFQGEGTSA